MEKKSEKVSSNSNGENKKKENSKKEQGFWDETRENVVEGAKVISEEAKHLSQVIASYSETIFGKIKDNTSEVIKYGLDLTHEGVHKAQEIAEQLKDDYEVRKLISKKKEVSTQLGMKFYLAVKNNKNKIPENLLKEKEIISLLKELEELDKQILNLSEQKQTK